MANEASRGNDYSLVLALGALELQTYSKRCSRSSNSRAPALRSKVHPFAQLLITTS